MGAHKYVVAVAGETLAAEHRLVNTICLNHTLPGIIAPTDLEAVAHDMAVGFRDLWYNEGGAREIRVKVYEYGPPPQFPKAEVVLNEDVYSPLNHPGEVALCLSFYSERNLPRQRGRIFLPACHFTGDLTANPGIGKIAKVGGIGGMLKNLGGADVDWSVHSQTTGDTIKVTNYWCDDEWDTIRSRGIPPKAARGLWTTSE